MQVHLTGKTAKGKNRVRENGAVWNLKEEREKVSFTNDEGPWLFIESLDGKKNRWVHKMNDVDFNVTLV